MRCFAALFWKSDCHQLSDVCMMITVRQSTTFNMGKFPNLYLASPCTMLCWYRKWKKTVGLGPVRETRAKGSELPGHKGKRRGRHCTGTVAQRCAIRRLGAARVASYPQTKRFSWDWASRGHRLRRCAGKCPRRCTANAMQCVPWKRPNPLCLPLVIPSTFFAKHGRRDSRSPARCDCADWPDDDWRWTA